LGKSTLKIYAVLHRSLPPPVRRRSCQNFLIPGTRQNYVGISQHSRHIQASDLANANRSRHKAGGVGPIGSISGREPTEPRYSTSTMRRSVEVPLLKSPARRLCSRGWKRIVLNRTSEAYLHTASAMEWCCDESPLLTRSGTDAVSSCDCSRLRAGASVRCGLRPAWV
jgi:hypothetical protein